MKPFNEKDLIAYHLHELSPRKARALEQALQVDPSLAAESEAYAAMLRSFKASTPLDVDEEIVDRNWDSLWSKMQRIPAKRTTFSRWRIPVLAAGLAFAAALFFVATQRHTTASLTGTMGRSSTPTDSMPSTSFSENPFTADATTDGSHPGHSRVGQQPALRAIPLAVAPMQSSPPHITASIPHDVEPAPVLRPIPLALVAVPLLPELTQPSITMEPTSPELSGPGSSSKLKHHCNSVHRDHPADLTFAMGGVLIGTRDFTSGGTTHYQGATHAVSAIASFHQQFRPAIGYRVAVSYARPTFQYGNSGQSTINGRLYEVAGMYVVQGPHGGRVSTSVEAGGGLMSFQSTDKNSNNGSNLRGAAIIGVGADFAVTKHLSIQASYRMQVFKGPDFQSTGQSTVTPVPVVATTLISNEPMVGITYHFSSRK